MPDVLLYRVLHLPQSSRTDLRELDLLRLLTRLQGPPPALVETVLETSKQVLELIPLVLDLAV